MSSFGSGFEFEAIDLRLEAIAVRNKVKRKGRKVQYGPIYLYSLL